MSSDHPAPVVNLVGEKIALGPVNPDQYATFHRWQNDPFVIRTWEFAPHPRTMAKTAAQFETGLFAQPTTDCFALYERADWRLIGYAGLINIDHVNRIAEFGILIGEADARGKGYGTEATRLLLDHAFLALGLSNVILRVFAYNLAGIRAYEKAGFRTMGVRRKSKMMGGKLWDTVYMEAVADEFESPLLGQILIADQPR